MNAAEWVGVGAGIVTMGGVVAGIMDRIMRGKYLTREEHERICQERNNRVQRSLDELREGMNERHTENRETLGEIRDTVTGMHERMDTLYRDLIQRAGAR